MPKISVIVPVYNVEKYLCRCIDSILAQTFTDFELILIDDGSRDNSGDICDEYAKKDPRIVVVHKENGGASSARNYGLDIAQAPWISFVDSDDYVDPEMYADLIALQKKYNADMFEFGWVQVENDESVVHSVGKVEEIIVSGKDIIPKIYQNCLGGTIFPCNKLFRAELFSDVRFMEGRICEDTIILPELYFKSRKVVITNRSYYYYFQSANSVMRSEFSIKKLDAIFALQHNRKFYLKNKLTEALRWHDSTYAFVLIKMMDKTREKYGLTCPEYVEMRTEFLSLLRCFMMNSHINMRQKFILLRYGAKLSKEKRSKDC